MRKFNKKKFLVVVSLVLVLTAAVGGTVAYIIDVAGPVVNTFDPSHVLCEVQTDTSIKNTGDTAAYIRAFVVLNYKNGEIIQAGTSPVEITLESNSGWEKSGNYYYYTYPVSASGSTTSLVSNKDALLDVTGNGTPTLEIVAQAIQATPADAVKDAWGADVAELLGLN